MNRLTCLVTALLVLLCGMPMDGVSISDTGEPGGMRGGGKTIVVNASGGGDYTRIQWAVDNASDGDTVYVEAGNYYESINITSNGINLTGEGSSSTTIIGSNRTICIDIRSSNNVISGFNITNSNCGVSIVGGEYNIIHNNTLYKNDGSIGLKDTRWSEVKNNILTYPSVFNIGIRNGSEDRIENNNLTGIVECNIFLHESREIALVNNNLEGGDLRFTQGQSGYHWEWYNEDYHHPNGGGRGDGQGQGQGQGQIMPVIWEYYLNHDIIGNERNCLPLRYYSKMTDFTVPANSGQVVIVGCKNFTLSESEVIFDLSILASKNGTIKNNTFFGTKMIFKHSGNLTIEGNCFNQHYVSIDICNVITFNRNLLFDCCLVIDYSEDLQIIGNNGDRSSLYIGPFSLNIDILENTFSNNSGNGILIDDMKIFNISIENNICSGNNESGIRGWADLCSDNICNNNRMYGIYGGSNILLNNTCNNNGWDGINSGYVDQVAFNNCTNNCRFGMNLAVYSSKIHHNNLISNSDSGIFVYNFWDKESQIFENNFISNSRNGIQVQVNGSKIRWDDGNSRGNFWSDYTRRYPDAQNNGTVWNIPYVINSSENMKDRSPLVNPVNIDHIAPIAKTVNTITVKQHETVIFDGSMSYGYPMISNYTWTFNYNSSLIHLYGPAPSFTFHKVGTYPVTLTVTNEINETDTDLMAVTVLDGETPTANAGDNMTIETGGTVHFNGTNSTDNIAIVNYTWYFSYNNSNVTLYGPTPSFTFHTPGTYVVTLTVNDAENNSDQDNMTVTVRSPEISHSIIVDASGNGDFLTIQEGIDNSQPGGTVFVREGHYRENVFINKTLDLEGAGKLNTTLDGGWLGDGITIESAWVNVSGFLVFNCNYGVVMKGNHSTVRDLNCTGNIIGIVLLDSRYGTVKNSNCDYNYGAGIYITSSDFNIIENCTCDHNRQVGLSFYYSTDNVLRNGSCSYNNGYGLYSYWLSNYNEITGYTCRFNNKSGIYIFDSFYNDIGHCKSDHNNADGIYLMTTGSTVSNCTAGFNELRGFHLYHTDQSTIEDCISEGNRGEGMILKYSEENSIIRNIFAANELGMKIVTSSSSNLIHSNDFILNGNEEKQAWDDGSNVWNTAGTGNFWSDWTTPDADVDGIVDNPYVLTGTSNASDLFPLAYSISGYIPALVPADNDTTPGNDTEEDSDGDGHSDEDEREAGSDPDDNMSTPLDLDGDGVMNEDDDYPLDPERWERDRGKRRSNFTYMLLLVVIVSIIMFIGVLGYTRIKRKRILDNDNRHSIYAYIIHHPGARFGTIKKELGISNGTLSHHIRKLEEAKLVRTRRKGNFRFIYPTCMDEDPVPLTPVQNDMIRILKRHEGISADALGAEMGKGRKTVLYHLGNLGDMGLVRCEEWEMEKCWFMERGENGDDR